MEQARESKNERERERERERESERASGCMLEQAVRPNGRGARWFGKEPARRNLW